MEKGGEEYGFKLEKFMFIFQFYYVVSILMRYKNVDIWFFIYKMEVFKFVLKDMVRIKISRVC